MKSFLLLLLAWCCTAAFAAPPLVVPDERLCATQGPTAVASGAFLIETKYDLATYTGTVRRRGMTVSETGEVHLAAQPSWDAASLLDAREAERKLLTIDGSGALTAFAPETMPGDVAAWLKGDRSGEIGQPEGVLRKRQSILGDIVNSTPLIVGAPSPAGTGPGYAAFHERFRNRTPVVYVGANDGMLHAFDAGSGAELFAYVPRALLPHVGQLSRPDYRHRPFMDGSAGHGEALLAGQWKSVLAAGMGMGGRGIIALDITDPASPGALWEFTEADDPAMGHVRMPPLVVKLKSGYYVMVASGINTISGDGALFLLALDKPRTERWRAGSNYFRLRAPSPDPSQANALSAPALAVGSDGSVRYAYAGDLQGNLWRFDLGAKSAKILFVARDGEGARQPIAHAPRVVFAPGGGYLVLFGTGKFIEAADAQGPPFTQQSFYAIHDNDGAAVESREKLAVRTLSGDSSYRITGPAFDLQSKRGWYFDFPHARSDGERAAGSPASVAGAIIFDSLQPGANGCASLASRTYVLDALTGLAYTAEGIAKPGATTAVLNSNSATMPPILIHTGVAAGARNATGGVAAMRSVVLLKPTGGAYSAQRVKVSFAAGRLGWREVANWRDLHDAARKER